MRFAAKLLSVLFITAIALPAQADDRSTPGTIEIQGLGEIAAQPDMAYITSGVVTQAENAKDALAANTTAMTGLIAVLTEAGIEERDIQTSNFSVQPQYVYSDKRDDNGYTLPPQISGYQVSNSVAVRVRALDTLGTVLDKAVTIGANTIENISFGVDQTGDLYNAARKSAVKDAIAKAELYAEAAGVKLGRLQTIAESQNFAPKYAAGRMATMEMADSAPVPVQAGEVTYSINVTMRWEIEQ